MRKYNYYFGLYDLAKKTRVKYYFDLFLRTLDWSKEELTQYRLKRLKALLAHAHANCPYYRERFDRAGITPGDVRSLEDLQYVPVLTRQDIRDYPGALLSLNKKQYQCFKESSSGSTGIPITYYHDQDGTGAGLAAWYFIHYLSNWRPGDRSLLIWGNPASIQNWQNWGSKLKRWVFHQKNLPATLLNDQANYQAVITVINRFKPKFIDGYASSIYSLADYLQEQSVNIQRPDVVFTTAENLFPYQREVIEKTLANVSDIYGCGEINGIAVQPIHSENYYILEPHVIVETADDHTTGLPEIIVTDLDNYIMPFIRYKPGDFISPIQENDGLQGLKFAFFTKVYGRSSDIIRLSNGKNISAITIVGGTAFRQVNGIVKHKVTWDGSCLHFMFEINRHFNRSRVELEQKIREDMNASHLPDLKFKIETVKRILPDKNGKFKYFEQGTPQNESIVYQQC